MKTCEPKDFSTLNQLFYPLKTTTVGNAFATSYYDNETRLSFDLSEVSSLGTELLMSELHLFKRRLLEKELGSNLCQVTIYDATFGDRSVHSAIHTYYEVN